MINYSVEESILLLGNSRIDFKFKIDKVVEKDGVLFILLFRHDVDVSQIPLNNLFAIDALGEIVWNVKDTVKSDGLYVLVRINDLNELIIREFYGENFVIEPKGWKLIERKFIK